MTNSQRAAFSVMVSAAVLIGAAGCAAVPAGSPAPTSSASQGLGTAVPALPEGRVVGVSTAIDRDGEVQLCTGGIMESYPPQCRGIALEGWSWDGVDGSESSSGSRWGDYAVFGTYDGTRLTVDAEPVPLALYDSVRQEDPTGGVGGRTPDAELARIQDELTARLGPEADAVYTYRGYVWLQVAWDDGTLQDAADAEYGDGVVIVSPALRAVE